MAVEEALTILISFLVGYGIDNFWAWVQKKIPGKKKGDRHLKIIIKRARLHHNIVGYLIIITGFFYYPLILVPFGIGIILGHRVRDELFWFIEGIDKDTKKFGKQMEDDEKVLRKKQIKLKRRIQNDIKELRESLK